MRYSSLASPFSIFPGSPLAQQNKKSGLEMIPSKGIFKLLRFPRFLEKGAKISLDGKAGLHHPMLHFFQRIDVGWGSERDVAPFLSVESTPQALPGDKSDRNLSFRVEDSKRFM
jgi:hypothetical protein